MFLAGMKLLGFRSGIGSCYGISYGLLFSVGNSPILCFHLPRHTIQQLCEVLHLLIHGDGLLTSVYSFDAVSDCLTLASVP